MTESQKVIGFLLVFSERRLKYKNRSLAFMAYTPFDFALSEKSTIDLEAQRFGDLRIIQ